MGRPISQYLNIVISQHLNRGTSGRQEDILPDIEGAFDNVFFKAISEALAATKLEESTAKWIMNTSLWSHIATSPPTISKRIRVRRCTLQGGILSPLLWNLVVDILLKCTAKCILSYLKATVNDLISIADGYDTDVIWERTQKLIKPSTYSSKPKGCLSTSSKPK